MKGGEVMKKTIALIVSLLFVLSVAGLSFAEEKKEAAPAPAAKEEQKMHKKHHHAKKDGQYVHGEVTAVDAAANTLTIKGKKDEVTLTTDDKTKFHKGKTLADVKVGDKLAVKYSEADGKMVAKSIKMKKSHHRHHGKKEMKKEEKKEEKK